MAQSEKASSPLAAVLQNDSVYQTIKNPALGTVGSRERSASSFTGVPVVCVCILVVELCERLAFYTFTGTQESFLEQLGYSVAQSGGLNATMATLCMVWAVFAGWVADGWLGRYRTIILFGLIYAFGTLVTTAAAWPSTQNSTWYLVGIMLLVPIGTAGIKANISNFGADQYDVAIPEQAAAQEKFFSWFYLAINLGSAVAYGYLTTMGSNGGLGVPRKYGYFAVYLISALCMLTAVALFRSGQAKYRMQRVQPRSSLGVVTSYVMVAVRSRCLPAISVCMGIIFLVAGIALSVAQSILLNTSFSTILMITAFVAAAMGIVLVVVPCLNPDWIGAQTLPDETITAPEVKSFLRILPLLFTANLAFSCVYNSMQFWYQQQACQMDVRMPWSTSGSQFAGSFFMIADCLAIVLATPLAVDVFNPMIDKSLGGRFGYGAKYGLGMTFGVASVMVAAHMEQVRRQAHILPLVSNCAAPGIHMSEMSASWMVLPFFLMGVGEIYTQPVLMHLAYTKSPTSMRTLTSVVGLVIGAVSNAIFTVTVAAVSPWVPNDLNDGHLEYGHYTNIALGVLAYFAFVATLQHFEHAPQE